MKAKHIIPVLVLAIAVALAATFCSKPAYERAYDKYLKENQNKTITIDDWTKKKLKKFTQQQLIDLDGDGVKEMILTCLSKEARADYEMEDDGWIGDINPALVLTYHDKKVKIIGSYCPAGGGYLKYVPGKNCFTVYDRLSGEEHICVYQLSDGEFSEAVTLDYYQPHHYEVDSKKDLYFMNKKEIDKATFDKNWDIYYTNATLIK